MRNQSAFPFLLAAAILFLYPSCGVLDVFDPDQGDPKDRVAVGTILKMPEVLLSNEEPVLPQLTAASVFLGKRGAGADIVLVPPEPLEDADVTMTMIDDTVEDVSLPHEEDGFYVLTSEEDERLEYRAGATYRATIVQEGEIYEIDVEQAPAPETPMGVPSTHPRNQELVISWTQQRTALVEVYRLTLDGARQTYTNRPNDIREVVLLALEKEPEEPELSIPGDAFSSAGAYVLVFFLLERGFPDKGLFAGSTLLAGAGEAVPFEVTN